MNIVDPITLTKSKWLGKVCKTLGGEKLPLLGLPIPTISLFSHPALCSGWVWNVAPAHFCSVQPLNKGH
jgi:hypothetical protein